VNGGSTTPTSSPQVGRVGFAPGGQRPVVSQDRLEAMHRTGFAPLPIVHFEEPPAFFDNSTQAILFV
jgi:hypothetical protein